jgi:hypothetical protein
LTPIRVTQASISDRSADKLGRISTIAVENSNNRG